MSGVLDLVLARHRLLEQTALLALEAGRLLMESGAKAEVVSQGAMLLAKGLGAKDSAFRVGYASLSMTLDDGEHTITRMTGVGAIGVNLRLNHEMRFLCAKVAKGGMTPEEVQQALSDVAKKTKRHSWPVVALAVGVACASFGRLLGLDWLAFLPVLLAGAIGQGIRHHLLRAGLNAFVMAAVVAFAASVLAGLGAELLGSATVKTAMSAAVLLLVPGVPVLNAQTDIMEGHPTLGSARAVSVLMVLVFLAVGVWMAEAMLGGSQTIAHVHYGVAHQTLFGAVAAAGFGILFNFAWADLVWAAAAGAIALAVRTLGLDAGWSLEAASFVAAAAVGFGIHLLDLLPTRVVFAGNTLAVAGCIPMIPGSAAAQGILGLFGLTAPAPSDPAQLLLVTVEYGLTVIFTIGAIGTGLTLATHLLRRSEFP